MEEPETVENVGKKSKWVSLMMKRAKTRFAACQIIRRAIVCEGIWCDVQMVCCLLPADVSPEKRSLAVKQLRQELEEEREVSIWYAASLREEFAAKEPGIGTQLALLRIEYAMKNRKRRENDLCFESLAIVEDSAEDGSTDIAYQEILQLFYTDMNHITVIGNHEEAYDDFAGQVFQETGLVMRFLKHPLREYPYGNKLLVLSFETGRKRLPAVFGKSATCVQVCAGMLNFLDTIAKNGYKT